MDSQFFLFKKRNMFVFYFDLLENYQVFMDIFLIFVIEFLSSKMGFFFIVCCLNGEIFRLHRPFLFSQNNSAEFFLQTLFCIE